VRKIYTVINSTNIRNNDGIKEDKSILNLNPAAKKEFALSVAVQYLNKRIKNASYHKRYM
jgi:hypothetical protein